MKVEIEIRARGRTFNSKTIFFIRQLKSSPLFSPAFRLHIFLIFRKNPRLHHFFPPARANAARPKSSDQTAAAWTNKTQPHLIFAQICRLKSNMKQKILPLPCPKKSGSLHWNRFFLQYICRPIFRASRKPPRAQARRLQPQPPPVPARCKSGCRSPRFRP